jgi:hypothetical protein
MQFPRIKWIELTENLFLEIFYSPYIFYTIDIGDF